jgi:acetyl/propionyl-CoA carboxylase alpha subunit
VDAGVYEGGEVPLHYDPLMAKLIVWGEDRWVAIDRMTRALDEFSVAGVQTTIPFHRAVMRHPDFVAGRLSTAFVERAFAGGNGIAPPSRDRARAAAVAVALRARERTPEPPPTESGPSRWAMASRPGSGAPRR